jgi:hypothetical protein
VGMQLIALGAWSISVCHPGAGDKTSLESSILHPAPQGDAADSQGTAESCWWRAAPTQASKACPPRRSGALLADWTPAFGNGTMAPAWINRWTDGDMSAKPRTPEETYGPALAIAQRALRDSVPGDLAQRAAVPYQELGSNHGRWEIPFFGALNYVYWPECQIERAQGGQNPDIATRIILLHYLLTADGSPLASRWIAFRVLPGGMGYEAAFQQRAGLRLAQSFGGDQQAFKDAGLRLGGEPLEFGDASLLFRALPRVWMAIVLYVEDDEFPASANILFDAAVSHYLPTEDLAVLGGLLSSRLVKAARTT